MNYQTAKNMGTQICVQILSFQPGEEREYSDMTNEVFFLWRKCGQKRFWQAVQAEEPERWEMVLDAINKYSTSGLAVYSSGFMTSYRRFLEFLEVPFEPAVLRVHPESITHSERTRYVRHKDVKILDVHEIEQVHKTVIESPDYELISRVFRKFPLNNDPEITAMKITLIDMTNSTLLGAHRSQVSTYDLVQLILNTSDFDERVRQGDPELVNLLARNTGKVNLFLFATKYCTYHNVDIYGNDDYSIFDSVVAKSLPGYSPTATAADFVRWRKAYNYQAFADCITEILDRNEIQIDFRRRKFDHYIWYTNR